jgi:hypothetical protein
MWRNVGYFLPLPLPPVDQSGDRLVLFTVLGHAGGNVAGALVWLKDRQAGSEPS